MGYITLADYRTEIQVNLGSRALANSSLDRYINFGYLDVCSAINADLLDSESSLSTSSGSAYVSIPANTLVVKYMRNVSADALMSWTPFADIHGRKSTPLGAPSRWNVYGGRVYLRPIPDNVYSLIAFLRKSPTRLMGGTDASILGDEFDTCIMFLANYHGFLLNGEEERAAYWLSLAINNLQTKIVRDDIDPHGGGGLEALKQRLSIIQSSQQGA